MELASSEDTHSPTKIGVAERANSGIMAAIAAADANYADDMTYSAELVYTSNAILWSRCPNQPHTKINLGTSSTHPAPHIGLGSQCFIGMLEADNRNILYYVVPLCLSQLCMNTY